MLHPSLTMEIQGTHRHNSQLRRLHVKSNHAVMVKINYKLLWYNVQSFCQQYTRHIMYSGQNRVTGQYTLCILIATRVRYYSESWFISEPRLTHIVPTSTKIQNLKNNLGIIKPAKIASISITWTVCNKTLNAMNNYFK